MKKCDRGCFSFSARGYKLLVITVILSVIPFILSSYPIKEDILKSSGARASGFGGAFTAVADDYSAFYWNPAGLVLIDRMSATVFYDSVFKNSQNDIGINYTHPLFDNYTLAFSYFHTGYADSNFSDNATYLTGAAYLDDKKMYAVGANMKFFNTQSDEFNVSAGAMGLDIGVMVFPEILEKKIRFGFIAQDLDEVMVWNNGIRQRVPLTFKMGSAYSFDPTLTASMDIDIIQSEAGRDHSRTGLSFGAEKWFLNRIIGNFGVRGGFNWREALDPNYKFTLGFSYGREDFVLDYVYILPVNTLGETHKINISYFFGSRASLKAVEEEKPKATINDADVTLYSEKYKLMEFNISQKYVSPNKDGIFDYVEFTVNNKPQDFKGIEYKFRILDQTGHEEKTQSGEDKVPESYIWRGENNLGVNLPDGDYTAELSILYMGKEIWKRARVVTIDTTAPDFTLKINPKVFAPVKNSGTKELTVEVKTKANDIKSWQMFFMDAGKHIIRTMSGEGFTAKISWAGRDAQEYTVKDGAYSVTMIITDYAGNKTEVSDTFKVDTYVTKVKVTADRHIFKPIKESAVFIVDFGEPDRIKNWDFNIYTKGNVLVKSFKNRSAAVKKLTWDGTDDNLTAVRMGSVYEYRTIVRQKNEISSEQSGMIQTSLPEFKDAGIQLTLAALDFAAGDRSIPESETGYLNQTSEAVKKYAKDFHLYIKAYATDAGGPEENLALSIARAEAVRDYLVTAQGVPAVNVYIIGMGDGTYAQGPISKEALKAGRRVEVELLTK
jgi:outer membrane protein OmpA-like peptidoglycan-associated protein